MTHICERLRAAAAKAQQDKEFQAAARGLPFPVALEVDQDSATRVIAWQGNLERQLPGLLLRASYGCWEKFLSATPPPDYQSFTAGLRFAREFSVIGDALSIAQALHCLERFFEILRGQLHADDCHIDRAGIHGHYIELILTKGPITLYLEEVGEGAPLLMLHTAGADSRQYHGLMADRELRSRWRMMAFDMPGHGRSPAPARTAWTAPDLKRRDYLSICHAVIQQYAGAPCILLGCSMGAAMALYIAARNPDDVAGVIALEAPWKAAGRLSPMLCNPLVNQAAHNPAYVRGLMAPQSPLGMRREAAWIYSQGGFGIYAGDLSFYSADFNAPIHLAGLDARHFEISLLTGEYDYSTKPKDSQRVAAIIPGSRYLTMSGLGHFPMIENPPRLLNYLRPELKRMEPD